MKDGAQTTSGGADVPSTGRPHAHPQPGRIPGRWGAGLALAAAVTFLVGCVGYVEGGYHGGYHDGWWSGSVGYEPRVDVHVYSTRGYSSRRAAHDWRH